MLIVNTILINNEVPMQIHRAMVDKTFDVRLRDKHLTEGKILSEEIKKYLDGLPDDSENVMHLDHKGQPIKNQTSAPSAE